MNSSTAKSVTARELAELTVEVAGAPENETKLDLWRQELRRSSSETLIEATARLSTDPGKRTRDIKALREAIISEIQRKSAESIVETMNKLDASASRLTLVSLVLAVVGVALAAIQVAQAFR